MKISLLLTVLISHFAFGQECIQIYYDGMPEAKTPHFYGRTHAQMLNNLLGHFRNYEVKTVPVEEYKVGGWDRCHASFYLGTHYASSITREFIEDFKHSKKNVVWLGYGAWKFPSKDLKNLWGVKFKGLSTMDKVDTDEKRRPTFYRFYDYKGLQFEKYGEWNPKAPSVFNASFEISLLERIDENVGEVVSWAEHNGTLEQTPYILRNKKHWYIADSPFSFIHPEDRYLIFADVLFDILNEAPLRSENEKPALLRIEDVHPKTALWQLYRVVDLLEETQIPAVISLIPIFRDPLKFSTESDADSFVTINENKLFVEFLQYAKARGVEFVYHGVTHQYGNQPNPFTATSGDDFEFWDTRRNAPIKEDSARYVVSRLEDGLSLMRGAGVSPVAWLTPHYQASPLDYVIFGQLFQWNIGRVIYFPSQIHQSQELPANLGMDRIHSPTYGNRMEYFEDLKVTYEPGVGPAGQFYPYEIYGDSYGQRIIPENIGNIQPYLNEQVLATRDVDHLLNVMKRNIRMRDAWASFFVHPFLFENRESSGIARFNGDMKEFKRLILGVKSLGYRFVKLSQWIKTTTDSKRPTHKENLMRREP